MKRFTTSAQKTLVLPKHQVLAMLEKEMDYEFELTNNADIKQTKMVDDSKLVIAAFDKANGKTLAMIDFKDIPESHDRATIQTRLKKTLEKLFSSTAIPDKPTSDRQKGTK